MRFLKIGAVRDIIYLEDFHIYFKKSLEILVHVKKKKGRA
jgi:hypothetical protein